MTVQVYHAFFLGLRNKLLIQFCITCYKYHVHQGAVFLRYRTFEQGATVDIVIKLLCFGNIRRVHCRHSAHLFDQLEHFTCNINREAWRCIIHGILIRMNLVVQISRHFLICKSQQVFSGDDDSYACRRHILLCAGKNQSKLADINFFTQNTAGHIGY